jgi:hypothetical protein
MGAETFICANPAIGAPIINNAANKKNNLFLIFIFPPN